jgi:hypothetical protein
MEDAQRLIGNQLHVETRSKLRCRDRGLEERFNLFQTTAPMPSRLAGKISLAAALSLAPALTANWLIIMAGVAVIACGSASAPTADEDNCTSEQSGSKWRGLIGRGCAHASESCERSKVRRRSFDDDRDCGFVR